MENSTKQLFTTIKKKFWHLKYILIADQVVCPLLLLH